VKLQSLLIVSALIEAAAGLALLTAPSALASLLLGPPLEAPVALAVARIAGVALLSLAVACWFVCGDPGSRTARGLIIAMLLYNLGTVVILGVGGTGSKLVGVGLWPGIVLHAAMAFWCTSCLRRTSLKTIEITELTDHKILKGYNNECHSHEKPVHRCAR